MNSWFTCEILHLLHDTSFCADNSPPAKISRMMVPGIFFICWIDLIKIKPQDTGKRNDKAVFAG